MHSTARLLWLFAALLFLTTAAAWAQDQQNPCPDPKPVPDELRLEKLSPGEPVKFEKQVLQYLQTYKYRNLGWCVDKGVRDTGPFVNSTYYGTHLAVRIYYSPEVMTWLRNGRRGPIADGAVILKEHYRPPAVRYKDKTDADLRPTDWTFMIKDKAASHDGWFWGEVWDKMEFPSPQHPNVALQYPNSGFGLYCVRCHASAEREQTFSALNNINGYPGGYLTFRVDDTWRIPANGVPGPAGPPSLQQRQERELLVTGSEHELNQLESENPPPAHFFQPLHVPDNAFSRFFVLPGASDGEGFPYFPFEPLDHIVEGPKGLGEPKLFVTSDQCQSCHSGLPTGPYGPNMFIAKGPNGFNGSPSLQGTGINVSPYGEWRWSPMGLAGRDPIFFAQFESEIALLDLDKLEPKDRDTRKQQVTDTCFSCHGAMGKRQFYLDHHGDQHFQEEFVFDTKDGANFKYGALARDGISCAICHHIVENKTPGLEYFLEHSINGEFELGKPDEMTGPFKDDVIATYPMDTSIGVKPKFNAYITSARLCGSCHTINLPVVDEPPIGPISPQTIHSVEQNTYLEWVNSQYQNEFPPVSSNAKTCQDCHMPGGYTNAANNISVPQIQTRIASVEDDSYPAAEHSAPLDKLRVRYRDTGFGRHELVGINAFLLEMFNQFSWVMGVRTTDYMSGATNDLPNAIDNMVQQAQSSTARVEVTTDGLSIAAPGAPTVMTARVKVANLAGHRFPSGVGFRRAFIELVVKDASGKVVWGSGRTNELGVIVGSDGKTPLPTEFFERDANGEQQYQKHYDEQNPITFEQQVQIYEELNRDAQGDFTTSFLRRDKEVKDNRLLPIGWTEHGPCSIPEHFLEATYPKGRAKDDPNYRNGKGISVVKYQIPLPPGLDLKTATVTATLYYQSIPPYYLADRFRIGGNRPNTKRLYYLTSNLDWRDTPFANWRLMIASASAPVTTASRP
jgi:Cytochrome P460